LSTRTEQTPSPHPGRITSIHQSKQFRVTDISVGVGNNFACTFSAKPGENAQDWMERYELTGRYNHWDAAEMRANFVMYLEGTARKWFLFTNVPADWEDHMVVAATATVAAIPFVAGLRTFFLQEFRQDNFALIQEAKLRKRFQKETRIRRHITMTSYICAMSSIRR
jgi:hypothetical protein